MMSFVGEPETVKWIVDQVAVNGSFVDVGANVGAYSLLYAKAALGRQRSDIFALALEPEASNYSALQRNIQTNDVGQLVHGLPVAIADVTGLGSLTLSELGPGAALHVFDEFGVQTERLTQATWSVPLRDLQAYLPEHAPIYLKVDVDGLEYKVLEGAGPFLSDPRLLGVLAEVNTQTQEGVHEILCRAGLDPHYIAGDCHQSDGTHNRIYSRHSEAVAIKLGT